MKIICPKCGQHYDADPEYIGEVVQCACGMSFVAEVTNPEDQSHLVDATEESSDVGSTLEGHHSNATGGSITGESSHQGRTRMKSLTCEMCGSSEIIKTDGVFVCQSCGMKYSVEEARKMMIEGTVNVTGTVKVDHSDKLQNLYKVARRAKSAGDVDQASKYYDLILQEDGNSWEASYYVAYYKTLQCTIAGISDAANYFKNIVVGVVSIIAECQNIKERTAAYKEIASATIQIGQVLFSASSNHYNNIDYTGSDSILKDIADSQAAHEALQNDGAAVGTMLFALGDAFEYRFRHGDKCITVNLFVSVWTAGVNIWVDNAYVAKIRHYSPNFAPPEVQGYSLPTHVKVGCGCAVIIGIIILISALCSR